MYVAGLTLGRFWHSPPTTVAPAVVASPRSSSSGSWPTHGRSGRATLTRRARSRWTVRSLRGVSKDTWGRNLLYPSDVPLLYHAGQGGPTAEQPYLPQPGEQP